MRIFLTGVDGYIGSLLGPILMDAGHEVVGLDTGFYRDGWLYNDPKHLARSPKTLCKDLRSVSAADVEGMDAIVHLAELSNDPLGNTIPEITRRINHLGSVQLAKLGKKAGVSRFVYTSSCSVYGAGSGEFLDESAPVNPQTAYAECKVKVERDVGAMADGDFSPVFLRNATAYGASPRMRFDIVLNNLSGLAWVYKRIAMTSDGTPWRPLVHVLDICHAVRCAVEAPTEAIHNETFNVGQNSDNYRVKEIAEIVGDVFTGCEVTFGSLDGDSRSYRVAFDKIHERLPGFECKWSALSGAKQLRRVFERIRMPQETFEFRPFTRLKQLRYLMETRQVDDELFWTAP
jgi:nucleoside-diphosphate-sugar epimerase